MPDFTGFFGDFPFLERRRLIVADRVSEIFFELSLMG